MGLFDRFRKKKIEEKPVEEVKVEEKVEEIVEEKEPEDNIEETTNVNETIIDESKEEDVPLKEEVIEEPKVEEMVEKTVVEVKKERKPRKPKVVEEPKKRERPEKRDYGTLGVIGPDGKKYYPERTFMDRLIEADDDLLQKYSDMKNLFLSYKKVHTRVSKTNDAFRFEGKLIGKIIVAGNSLKVYLALDPMSVDSAIYHQRDASSKKHFAETPLVVKVKSPLSYRKAIVLIAMACEKLTIKKERFKPKDWTNPQTKEDKEEE